MVDGFIERIIKPRIKGHIVFVIDTTEEHRARVLKGDRHHGVFRGKGGYMRTKSDMRQAVIIPPQGAPMVDCFLQADHV